MIDVAMTFGVSFSSDWLLSCAAFEFAVVTHSSQLGLRHRTVLRRTQGQSQEDILKQFVLDMKVNEQLMQETHSAMVSKAAAAGVRVPPTMKVRIRSLGFVFSIG